MSRRHRRRWSAGHAPPPAGGLRVRTVPALPDCLPDMPCNWHGHCSECGDLIHLAGGEVSPGLAHYTPGQLAALIVGSPPRCRACRGLA